MPTLITPRKMREQIEAAESALAPHRSRRREAYQEVMGRYHPSGDSKVRHLNLIARALRILVPHIVANNPEHEVTSDQLAYRGDALLTAMYLDRLSDEVERMSVSRAALQDAFLGPRSIVRCGMRAGSEMVKVAGRLYDPGQPYVLRVPFDDWVCDPGPKHRLRWRFEGHFWDAPRAMVLESELFDAAVVERLAGAADVRRGHGTEPLTTPQRTGVELEDDITLLDLVFYDENGEGVVVTMPADADYDGDFLRVEPYEGPARGPYEHLEFMPINDEAHGLPPVADWRENAEAFYRVVGKMIDDVEATRRLLLVDESADKDELEAIEQAANGSIVRVRTPGAYTLVEFGGTSSEYKEIIPLLYQWNNTASGNTDILGGQGADTDRATIYAGLQANAGVIVEDYQAIVDEFETRISRHLAWWGTTDPLMKRPMVHRMPGGEYISVTFDAEAREGDFQDFRYRIRPRSMQRQDPNVKAANMLQLLGMVLQAAQVSAATGGMIDVAGVARIGGRQLGLREMQEIVNDAQAMMESQAIAQAGPQPVQGRVAGPGRMPPRGPRFQANGPNRSSTPIGAAMAPRVQARSTGVLA